MKTRQAPSLKPKDIRGQRLDQNSLQTNLRGAIAGQRHLSKLLATLGMFLACFISTFLVCYIAASIGLDSVFYPSAPDLTIGLADCDNPVESRLTILVMMIWGVVILSQSIRRSVVTMATLVPTALAVYGLLISWGLFKQPSDGLILSTISILVIWAMTFLTHSLFRYTIAALDILFYKALAVQGLLMGITVVAALIGSLNSVASSLGSESSTDATAICQYETIPLWATSTGVGVGMVWGMTMALGAWWVNHKRHVPWRSPDVFREGALAVGAWAGTSFRHLDLSNVNFQGARLANSDLRAQRFHHTCFREATGLERSRVDNHYLDLDHPNVQRLLTHGSSSDPNFRNLNLQGAYLREADMRGFDLTDSMLSGADLYHADLREAVLVRAELAESLMQQVDLRQADLTDANLTRADLRGADLRGVRLVRAQVAGADFKDADLTGVCIEDWSISDQTRFTQVRCDYIYRKLQNGEGISRYPIDRLFEPGEFEALFQKSENELELLFKGDFNYNALSLAFYKLQTEEPDLQLKLSGIEQRGNLWIVKVMSNNPAVEKLLEQRFSDTYQKTDQENRLEATIKESIYTDYEETKKRLQDSETLVRQLAGVSEIQAEALKEFSKKPFGNSFFITGSTITNLTGSGNIQYTEAVDQVRTMVSMNRNPTESGPIGRNFLRQLKDEAIAPTPETQVEFLQQVMVEEAKNDPEFRQYLLREGRTMIQAMGGKGVIARAIYEAVRHLKPSHS